MGRNAQLIRQWAILKQIEHNRWTTILDMAEHHVVSTKTIRRDLHKEFTAAFKKDADLSPKVILPDGVHLTAEGNQLMAKHLAPAIVKVLTDK